MASNSIAEEKSALRRQLVDARNLTTLSVGEEVVSGFTHNLIGLCKKLQPKTVACYLAFGSEPPTDGFLEWAKSNRLRVVLPIALPNGDLDWVSSYGSQIEAGIFGFAEALGDPAELSEADLIVIPALAVDKIGNRLGKGKGYYDRALDSSITAPIFAVVYESEVLEYVPHESHDYPVNGFVTESRIFDIQN